MCQPTRTDPTYNLTLLPAPLQLSPAIYCTPITPAAQTSCWQSLPGKNSWSGPAWLSAQCVTACVADDSTRPKSDIAGIGKEVLQSGRPDTSSTRLFRSRAGDVQSSPTCGCSTVCRSSWGCKHLPANPFITSSSTRGHWPEPEAPKPSVAVA